MALSSLMHGRRVGNPRKFLFVCVVTDDARLDAAAAALGPREISVITSCEPAKMGSFAETFGITHAIVDERTASAHEIQARLARPIDVHAADSPEQMLSIVRRLVDEAQRDRSADSAEDLGA